MLPVSRKINRDSRFSIRRSLPDDWQSGPQRGWAGFQTNRAWSSLLGDPFLIIPLRDPTLFKAKKKKKKTQTNNKPK